MNRSGSSLRASTAWMAPVLLWSFVDYDWLDRPVLTARRGLRRDCNKTNSNPIGLT